MNQVNNASVPAPLQVQQQVAVQAVFDRLTPVEQHALAAAGIAPEGAVAFVTSIVQMQCTGMTQEGAAVFAVTVILPPGLFGAPSRLVNADGKSPVDRQIVAALTPIAPVFRLVFKRAGLSAAVQQSLSEQDAQAAELARQLLNVKEP